MTEPKIGEHWLIERRNTGDRRIGRLVKIEGAKKPGWLHIGFDSWLRQEDWIPIRQYDLTE